MSDKRCPFCDAPVEVRVMHQCMVSGLETTVRVVPDAQSAQLAAALTRAETADKQIERFTEDQATLMVEHLRLKDARRKLAVELGMVTGERDDARTALAAALTRAERLEAEREELAQLLWEHDNFDVDDSLTDRLSAVLLGDVQRINAALARAEAAEAEVERLRALMPNARWDRKEARSA